MARFPRALWTNFAPCLAIFVWLAIGPAARAHNSACTAPLILPVDHFTWGYAERARFVRDRLAKAGEGEHLDELDYVLGLNTAAIETRDAEAFTDYEKRLKGNSHTSAKMLGLRRGHANWFTGYRDLAALIQGLQLKAGDTIVDLGAGTGRLGLLLSVLRPEISYIGIELVHTRAQAAQDAIRTLGVGGRVRMEQADLLDPYLKIPTGTHYYVYGPTNDIHMNGEVIDRLFNETDHDFKIITHHPITSQILVALDTEQLNPLKGHLCDFRVFQKANAPRP